MTEPSQDKLMPTEEMIETLHFVFDGPPGPECGRFVECETPDGHSVNAGEWHERADGYWELRVPIAARPPTDVSTDVLVANAIRLALEDADTLDQLAADADDNGWQEWGAMMRQSAGRTRQALEALQRSNAEKDEALRAAVDLVQMYGSTEAHEQVRKALSHSSDGGNNAV